MAKRWRHGSPGPRSTSRRARATSPSASGQWTACSMSSCRSRTPIESEAGSIAPAEDVQEKEKDVEGIEKDGRGDERSRGGVAACPQPLEVEHGEPGGDDQAGD